MFMYSISSFSKSIIVRICEEESNIYVRVRNAMEQDTTATTATTAMIVIKSNNAHFSAPVLY